MTTKHTEPAPSHDAHNACQNVFSPMVDILIKAAANRCGEHLVADALLTKALSLLDEAKPAPSISRPLIRSVFMDNGFTIKKGCDDLSPYVYKAAEQLLELAKPIQYASGFSDGYAKASALAEHHAPPFKRT